jgi:2-phospho-L-lactate guanylyltransferase
MGCWAVIPVKSAIAGKSRLAAVLSSAQRQQLIRAMLAHVIEAASAASNIDRVCLVGPPGHGVNPALKLIPDPGSGLNAALHAALEHLCGEQVSRMLVIAGDLPCVTSRELELLAAAPEGKIAIAPDRHGTGTNALSLPLPEAARFAFAFGPGSFAFHRAEAERLGLAIEIIEGSGLARDVDEPADLPDAAAVLAAYPG